MPGRVTIFFPAHASYFDGEFTQSEIDHAIKNWEFVASADPISAKIVLLREPGKFQGVRRNQEDLEPLEKFCNAWFVRHRKYLIEMMRQARAVGRPFGTRRPKGI